MPWPFSRREPASPGADPRDADARQGEARDPAAELRAQTRRRLIGAAVLLLSAVIVLPLLLDTAPRPMPEDVVITVASPPLAKAAKAPDTVAPVIAEKQTEAVPVPTESEPVEAPAPRAAAAAPAAPASSVAPAAASTASTAAASAAATREKFIVQVAALSSAAAADELTARLSKGGFSAYVEAVTTAGGTLHRVRVGPFARRDEAQRAVDRLKASGHKATVVGG